MATPDDIAQIRADPFGSFRVANVITTGKLDVPVDLISLRKEYNAGSKLDRDHWLQIRLPELDFEYNEKKEHVNVRVFKNGAIVMTGSRDAEQAKSAFKTVVDKILPHVVMKGKAKPKLKPPKPQAKPVIKRGRGRPKKQ